MRSEWRFMMFGMLMAGWSSLGQTFFISLFSAEIRGALSLSHGDFGTYYAIATAASAFTLVWLGKLADTVPVKKLSLITLACICASAIHRFANRSLCYHVGDWHLPIAPVGARDDVACLVNGDGAPLCQSERSHACAGWIWDVDCRIHRPCDCGCHASCDVLADGVGDYSSHRLCDIGTVPILPDTTHGPSRWRRG